MFSYALVDSESFGMANEVGGKPSLKENGYGGWTHGSSILSTVTKEEEEYTRVAAQVLIQTGRMRGKLCTVAYSS